MNGRAALQNRLEPAADQRELVMRVLASSGATLVLGLLVLALAPPLWPVIGLALVVSARVAGGYGLAASAATGSIGLSLLTATPGIDGEMCAVGLLAFVLAGVLACPVGPPIPIGERRQLSDHPTPELLTGSAFRATLALECRRAVRYGQPLSLVLLDIDRLGQVNEARGHPAGDHVIATVARALVDAARETDVAGHLGADRFAIIASGAPNDGLEIAERIRAIVAAALDATGPVTLSAGIAMHAEHARPADLLMDAEDALSLAKADGRDCVREAVYRPLLRSAA